MAANTAFSGQYDHESIKTDFKNFLKSQDIYRGYNFDGANFNVLFDLLAFNTNINIFAHNMVASESNLRSAQIRENAIAQTYALNYVPRSVQSAYAYVNLKVEVTDNTLQVVTIPAGFTLTGAGVNGTCTFQTTDDINVYKIAGQFVANNVKVIEGKSVTELFKAVPNVKYQNFTISNRNVNTDTIIVRVINSVSNLTTTQYTVVDSIIEIDNNSKIFFLQPGLDNKYNIAFGDNVFGKALEEGNIVSVTYLVSIGPDGNGISKFTASQRVQDFSVAVETIQTSTGGSEEEDIESIRYNSPRYFQSQGQGINTPGIAALILKKFGEISSVNVFGGEDLNPPQFGKTFVSCTTTSGASLSDVRKAEINNYLKPRMAPHISVLFLEPDIVYIGVNSQINYEPNLTNLTADSIKAKVQNSIVTYSNKNLNKFKTTLYYSRFIEYIDDIDPAIVSNETQFTMLKYINATSNVTLNRTFSFGNKISKTNDVNVYSDSFILNDNEVILQDDKKGVLRAKVIRGLTTNEIVCGNVNYENGTVNLNIPPASYNSSILKITAIPSSFNITAAENITNQISLYDSNIAIKSNN